MRCSSPLALLLALSLSTSALADPGGNGFGSFGLVDGDPDFIGCLRAASCSEKFFGFLNQATLEQGFAMQGGPPMASSVINHHTGWSVGGMLHTFPLGPPRVNLSGKTENTQFSPVLAATWHMDGTWWHMMFPVCPGLIEDLRRSFDRIILAVKA